MKLSRPVAVGLVLLLLVIAYVLINRAFLS